MIVISKEGLTLPHSRGKRSFIARSLDCLLPASLYVESKRAVKDRNSKVEAVSLPLFSA